MDWLHALVLAMVQGVSEFLPISSSAHLILLPRLADWQDQGLAFDIAVHVGTLAAVMLYFRHDLRRMSSDWWHSLRRGRAVGDSRLAWAVLFGTLPVGLAGLALMGAAEQALRSPLVIAWATIAFGVLLGVVDALAQRRGHHRSEHELRWSDILLIGLAQALALIPGTSRSGITMTAGLALGLSREAAARFSFLLSIPVILLAGLLALRDVVEHGAPLAWDLLLLGTVASGVFAYLGIHFFLRLLERIGMLPFVVYRLLLGGLLLALYL